MFADIVVIALAGNFFNHYAEQNEAVVAVLPAASGFELRSPVAVQLDVVLQGAKFKAVGFEIGSKNVSCAPGMGE